MPMSSRFPTGDGVLEIRAKGDLFGQEILNLYHFGVLEDPAGDPADPMPTLQELFDLVSGGLDAIQTSPACDKYTLVEYLVQVVDSVSVGATGRYEINYGLGGIVAKGLAGSVVTTDSLPSYTAASVSLTSIRDILNTIRKGGKRYAGIAETDTQPDPNANKLSTTIVLDYQSLIDALLPAFAYAPTPGVDRGASVQLGVLSRVAATAGPPVLASMCPVINIARVSQYASTQVSRKQR